MKFRKKKFANFADRGKRILALTLVTALSVTGNGVESFAAKPDSVSDGGKAYVYLEKATMPEEIQQNDVFYVAMTSAEFMESSEKSYVLTVGRGGEAKEASHVTVKLSDWTAKYGEDYTVRRMEDAEELPENPDSVNLFELMDQGEYEGEIPYSEEDMKTAVNQIVEETSGSFKASQEEKKSTSDNPLQQAKEELTGISSDREAMTGSGNDMIEMMSQVSNLLTETVAGTTLKLDFSPGEKEKEIVITPKDNRKSDGDRFFYLVLSEPSEGMKNSSISESIFTIKDDEPEVKASISFDVESFRAENGEVQVRLIREGALTQTVAVHMTSKDGSAKAGENYEGVDSEVVFPFGVKERNLTFTAKSDGLKTDADYTLSIKESSGAVTGEVAEAKVVIPKETKVKRVKASDRGKKISDVRLGNPITEFEKVLSDTGQKGATWESYSESSGKHSFDVTSEKQIYLYGYDNAAGSGGNGVVQANSRLIDDVQMKDSDRKDSLVSTYDGVRINWKVKRSGIIPSIIWSVYASDTTGTTDVGKQLYESKKTGWDEDWREDDFIFGMEDVFSWGFRNRTEDYTEEVWIKKVTPILRPFKVRLTEPEPVELYTGEVDANGVPRTSKNQEAVATTLAGSSDGNPVMKYDGDTIVIQNSLPVNLQTVKMVGAKIVKTNSENRTAEKSTLINPEYIQINQNTGIIELNNAFVREYRDYISFADMEGSVGDKQPSTIHRKYGYFNIQPVYGKTMTQGVTVNENTAVRDSSGKTVPVKIFLNGKEVTYGEKMTGYGIGDKLTFTAQCSDETYRVTGMDVDYYSEGNKRGESGTMNADPVDHDVKLTITTDYGYVFTPTIQSNDNKMVIRVREEDLSRFEATGFFTEENLAAHSAKNETYGYREIVVADADALQSVKEIYLAVEPKSGTVPVWKLTNVNRWVMG
ncbi:MAG: hypothetical protein IJ733_02260, partial [Lachnospiraceae bacterium]|nr:hypothetical protein [Lachnospiraceae bacterium]